MVTIDETVTACRALAGHDPDRPVPAGVLDAARSLCECEDLTEERARKLEAMRTYFRGDAAVEPYLGVHHARMPRRAATRLEQIDIETQAVIHGAAQAAMIEAAEQIDARIVAEVDRAKLTAAERQAFDTLPTVGFVRALRPTARARLTGTQEAIADAVADRTSRLVAGHLAAATLLTVATLDSVLDTRPVEASHELDRGRSVDLFRTAFGSMILARFTRAVDAVDEDPAAFLTVGEGLARDTLEVAGGVASTDKGGLVRADGRSLTVTGEPSQGANLAQGHTVSAEISTQLELVPVQVFRHSGASDARSIHKQADGRTIDELGGRVWPGQHPGCRCRWVIRWEQP